MTVFTCQACGEEVIEEPADPADWIEGVHLWVTLDGRWACPALTTLGTIHFHRPKGE